MKITMYSNYLNHHQLPLCEAFNRLTDNQFTFVATSQIGKERLALGYHDMNDKPFVISTSEGEEQQELAQQLDLESDIVIVGDAPEEYVRNRIRQGKQTFRHHERIYKKGRIYALHPGSIHMALTRHNTYRQDPLYLLCAGAYVAKDFALLGSYIGKTYKWGYFPELIEQNKQHMCSVKENKITKLLWVGRFIPYKHPDIPVEIARRLKQDGYEFELNMIGTGELISEIGSMIHKYHLEGNVHLLGPMHPEEVRTYMEQANIFLFTSNQEEGWGAVLNEAMNSCCAVVASDAIGAVPYLLNDRVNGLIYKDGNLNDCYEKIKILFDDLEYASEVGWESYLTLKNEWNAEIAAERLIVLSEYLKLNKETPFSTGPLSKDVVQHRFYF